MNDPSYSRAQAAREFDEELAAETVRELLPIQFGELIDEFLENALADARFDAAAHHPGVDCTGLLSEDDAEAELLRWLQYRAAQSAVAED